MQPQSYNSGTGGQETGEFRAGSVPVSQPGELPQPIPMAPAASPPATETGHTPGNIPEALTTEVLDLLDKPMTSPRQQADKIADVRRRYQQQVLGLKSTQTPEQEA